MKRLAYLAALSMVMMIVAAPAALAQQGNGLCAGATTVTSVSDRTSMTTEPFTINSDSFQVAVDTTPLVDTSDGSLASTTVYVDDEETITTITSRDFENGASGVINVSQPGTYSLDISTFQQAYDITVYACGAATGGDMTDDDGVEDDAGVTEDGATGGMTDDTADDVNGGAIVDQGTGAAQYDDADDGVADDDTAVTALPDTGGPSVLLIGATLLLGSGILGLAVLRRRSE